MNFPMKTLSLSMIGIYKITSPEGRIYIGQSRDIEKRFVYYRCYACQKQPRLYRSLKKYGVDNHTFEILEECSIELTDEREQYYIKLYDTFNTEHGLNLREGGSSWKVSEETLANMKKAHEGKEFPRWIIEKARQANIGRVRPQWERDRISKAHKGRKRSAEHQENQNEALRKSPKVQAKMKAMVEKCKKKVINTKTGAIYSSIKEAALAEGFLQSTLTNRLNGHRKNSTDLKYL